MTAIEQSDVEFSQQPVFELGKGVLSPQQPPASPDDTITLPQFHIVRRHPVESPTIDNLAEVSHVYNVNTYKTTREGRNRYHHLASVAIDGCVHGLLITEPLNGIDAQRKIFRQPGFGERIEDGIGEVLHENLAHFMPEDTLISHASHGVGGTSGRIRLRDVFVDSVQQMGAQTLSVLEALQSPGDSNSRLYLAPTSMGTKVDIEALNQNIDAGNPVEIAGVVNYIPCIVIPERVNVDIKLKFLPATLLDMALEQFVRTPLADQISGLRNLKHSAPHLKDIPASAKQALSLMKGTPLDEIVCVVEKGYPFWSIVGAEDPLYDRVTMKQLEDTYPNVKIIPVKGRGHAMFTNPEKAARNISNTIMAMDQEYYG